MAETNGRGAYVTSFARGRFTTQALRELRRGLAEDDGRDGLVAPPPVASARAYLRRGLPSIYQDGDFGLRFVGALEGVLDPVVAVVDSLGAYVDPELAPPEWLELLAAWLGVDLDEAASETERREHLRQSAELSRRRGTRRGLELALRVSFPNLPLRVEDGGGVVFATDPAKLPPSKPPQFVVYCDAPLAETEQAAVARTIEQLKPVHVGYRLRVKAPAAGRKGAS